MIYFNKKFDHSTLKVQDLLYYEPLSLVFVLIHITYDKYQQVFDIMLYNEEYDKLTSENLIVNFDGYGEYTGALSEKGLIKVDVLEECVLKELQNIKKSHPEKFI